MFRIHDQKPQLHIADKFPIKAEVQLSLRNDGFIFGNSDSNVAAKEAYGDKGMDGLLSPSAAFIWTISSLSRATSIGR